MSKIAKLTTLTRNYAEFEQDNLFNLDNVFYPILNESGVPAIYSRSVKDGREVVDRYSIDATLSDVDAAFNDSSSAYAEDVGLAELPLVAIDGVAASGNGLFPARTLSGPAYQVSQIKLRNGSVLNGTYTALVYLSKTSGGNTVFYVNKTLVETETAMNSFTNGLDRVIRLYTYWRDFRTTSNADLIFPAWLLYPINLIECPVEDVKQIAKPGEPNGLVINVMERNANRKIPYKVATTLDNLLVNITTPGAATLTFDVVNGNAPTFNG